MLLSATPPAPARISLPTLPPYAKCRDGSLPPAAHPNTDPAAVGCRSCTILPTSTDPLLLPSNDGIESLPATAPADKCPARSPLHLALHLQSAQSPPASVPPTTASLA